jgi:hypothetical protein
VLEGAVPALERVSEGSPLAGQVKEALSLGGAVCARKGLYVSQRVSMACE